jgi:phosphoribosylformimino-5-aminoimidazole carboxamide ribotide isomerase
MRIIPVIDLLGGVVVRAVAGRRSEYRPIQSQLVDSPDPRHVARRLLEASGATELYVADLDAIVSGNPVAETVREFLTGLGVRVWFDGGFQTNEGAAEFHSPVSPVIASETFGPVQRAGDGWAYSVDLSNGTPLGRTTLSPHVLAECAVAAGFPTLIVLDVARVGTDGGPGTAELIGELRRQFPGVELIAGGGIRGWDDVARLAEAGADAALVATALHDGRLRA